jgi:CRP/FNR family cyclic AMP-dependent transcriptional regulator
VTVIKLFQNTEDYKSFSVGETIFEKGEPGDVMYVVLEGQVDIKVETELIEHLAEGQIFGEMALIDKQPRSASAVALSNCRVAPVDQKRFTFLVQQNPYFAIQVMSVMADRLRRLMGVEQA